MDKVREQHVQEMNRLKEAISKTKSKYLVRDYKKAYNRMRRELNEYDNFKRKAVLLNG